MINLTSQIPHIRIWDDAFVQRMDSLSETPKFIGLVVAVGR